MPEILDKLVKEAGINNISSDTLRNEYTLSDDDVLSVALFLDWRTVATHLGLQKVEIDVIEKEAKSDKQRRLITLRKWQRKCGHKASYIQLAEALLLAGRQDQAQNVCRLLAVSIQEWRTQKLVYLSKDYLQPTSLLETELTKSLMGQEKKIVELRERIQDLKKEVEQQNQQLKNRDTKVACTLLMVHRLKRELLQANQQLQEKDHQQMVSKPQLGSGTTTSVHVPASEPEIKGGYLQGVDVVEQTSLIYSDKAYSFNWEKHGFKIRFPEHALPPNTNECYISITASISGQYQFPDGSELVSGIYWIACPVKFTQPITLEIQHCGSETDSNEDQFSFVTAKCSQEGLLYSFCTIDGGIFSSVTSYGSIQLTHFSGVGVIRRILRLCRSCRRYCARLYYILAGSILRWKVHMVIVCNLEIHLTAVDKKYAELSARPGLCVEVEFEGAQISLDICKEGVLVKGWNITPLIHPTIMKHQVNKYSAGRWIPSCQLLVEWKEKTDPVSTVHQVDLLGAKEPFQYITIELPPGPDIQPLPPNWPASPSDQQPPPPPNEPAAPLGTPLTAVNAVEVLTDSGVLPSSWQGLASKLRINDPESIATQKPTDSLRLQETLRQWLQNCIQASWDKLADEVSKVEGYGPATQRNILINAKLATQ